MWSLVLAGGRRLVCVGGDILLTDIRFFFFFF